jgi:uncharacterized protein (TIRG00374 family)
MEQKGFSRLLKTLLPLLLGGAILYWMYRDFDFRSVGHVMLHDMDWTWMLLSLPFGVLAQAMRGWRWKQTLEPIFFSRNEEAGTRSRHRETGTRNEEAGTMSRHRETGARRSALPLCSAKNEEGGTRKEVSSSACVNAVFVSYAASLVIPRIGEFTRCAVLKRWEGISFSKALGTVVTERAVDTLVVMLYSGLILLFQLSVFGTFFRKTGTTMDHILGSFSLTGWLVTAVCALAVLLLLYVLVRNLSIYNKVKTTLSGLLEGVLSLRGVKNLPLYLFFSIGIWVMYFLHFYLTFFCFDFTADLGLGCALVAFVVANFAVIVPTPNGAGPWHFAIKTMLILYGVQDDQALFFVLIVHTVQTLLVVLLGVYSWARLNFCSHTEGDFYSHAESQRTLSEAQSDK